MMKLLSMSPLACGGTATVTWTATSSCAANVTASATFTVPNATTVSLTAPSNTTTTSCQTQAAVNTAYNTWLTGVTNSGGCNVSVTNNSTGAPLACGGTATVTWTATSSCAANVTASATFT